MSWQLLWVWLLLSMGLSPLKAQLMPAVHGVIQDNKGNALEAATVVLLVLPDSILGVYSLTNNKGNYSLRAKRGKYALQVSYLGYQSTSIVLDLHRDTSLGILKLKEITDTLQLIEVTTKHIPIQMRGDTLSFNTAAFNMRSHDDASKLLRQLPGLNIQEDGTILFNGQKVTEILVDGKVFFGEDAQATLRTLSADAIKKIDITDTQISSKGIEPKEDQKTINLRLKKKAKTGLVGKVGLGYGTIIPFTNTPPTPQAFGDHRYQANTSMTYFTPNIRSAIYGRSNNVQLLAPLAMSRIAALGITRKNSIGATFNLVPSTATTWNNSYRYVQSRTRIQQNSKEISVLPTQTFERARANTKVNIPSSHNFNSNFTHNFDKQHLVRIRLTASHQNNNNQSDRLEQTTQEQQLKNSFQQTYRQRQQVYQLVSNLAFEKRFEKKGRQLIINLGTKWSNRPSNADNNALTNLYDNNGNYTRTDTLLQERLRSSCQQHYGGSVLWKEPFSKKDKLYITFKGSIDRDQNSQVAYDRKDNRYAINTNLSNTFKRHYNYQSLLLSWRRKTKTYRLEVTGGLRRSHLYGKSNNSDLQQEMYLPTSQVQLRYTLAKGKKLTFSYNLYLIELTIGQLQPFVDNTDPLAIQLGSSDLRPTINHRLGIRLDWFEQRNFTNIYTKLRSLLVPNTILQSQTIDNDLKLIYQPVNSTLSSNVSAEVGYNRLFQALDLVLDMSVNVSREQRPFLLNKEKREQIKYNYNFLFKLNNKKKKIIDWSINTHLNGGLFTYDNKRGVLNNYFNQYYGGHIGFEFMKHWNVQTNLGLSWYAQSIEEDPTTILWSLGIKRRFMKNEQLEIEVRAENLLNESLQLQRHQQVFVLREQYTQRLGRYVLLSIRYKFKKK